MAAPAAQTRTIESTDAESRRERRKRESFTPLRITAGMQPLTATGSQPMLGTTPLAIAGTVAEPAFHDVEEAFFRAGTEPTLQRNEGDEYEPSPRFWQRMFTRAE